MSDVICHLKGLVAGYSLKRITGKHYCMKREYFTLRSLRMCTIIYVYNNIPSDLLFHSSICEYMFSSKKFSKNTIYLTFSIYIFFILT